LKTANVFLNQNGVVKLGDFGVAKTLSETAGVASTCVGTPYYLAPEICRSQPYGFKADVWSLGVILYELVTLEVPFSAPDVLALVMRICNDKPRPAPTVYSEALRNLLEKLLQKDSATRPTATEILADPHMQRGLTLLLSHTTEHGTGGAEMAIREPPSPARCSPTSAPADKLETASQGEMIEAQMPIAADAVDPVSAGSKGPVTLPVVDRTACESPASDGSMVEESAPCSPASPSRNAHAQIPVDDREVTALRLSLLSVLEEALRDDVDDQVPRSVEALSVDADAMQEDILSDSLIRELDVSV
jgi:serine/threonine protein kinase